MKNISTPSNLTQCQGKATLMAALHIVNEVYSPPSLNPTLGGAAEGHVLKKETTLSMTMLG